MTDRGALGVVSSRFDRDLLEEVLNRSGRREKGAAADRLVLADVGLFSFYLFTTFAATGADLAGRVGASVLASHVRCWPNGPADGRIREQVEDHKYKSSFGRRGPDGLPEIQCRENQPNS